VFFENTALFCVKRLGVRGKPPWCESKKSAKNSHVRMDELSRESSRILTWEFRDSSTGFLTKKVRFSGKFDLCCVFGRLRIVYLKRCWVLVVNIEIPRAYYRIDMSYLFIIL